LPTDRRFCRFVRSSDKGTTNASFNVSEIPEGGICLSAFLIISSRGEDKVLMGHLNPKGNWDHIGALDKTRLEWFKDGWMLPSSHLIMHESPQAAARRILFEQLGLEESQVEVSDPICVSETYRAERFPERKQDHWDIEFIFKGTMNSSATPSKPELWNELKFVDITKTKKEEITRSHEDILKHLGWKFG